MAFIIGTAGHIDHGKTSLVKALTGQDTDRLKEEKERGISIDLGFAYLDLPNGERAGVVDVPGHERFVRHMLAGAHGVDLVLFTVAADDGVMPQTEEHLRIVHLLGVGRAIFVVTKTDVASDERVRIVEDEIATLVAGSPLVGSPIVRCSAVSGDGLDALRRLIVDTLAGFAKPAPPGLFRLPVDRVFVLRGHGLVVTGTARSGIVRVGDRVRALPGSHLVRVRGLHVHGRPVGEAHWGQRVALNLSGADVDGITRGHVISDERLDEVSERFDARVDMDVPSGARRRRLRVRLHVGTAERLGVLAPIDGPDEEADASGSGARYAQFILREPVQVMRGDRFVIRDETARHTLGGGVVLNPWPRRHRRRDPARRQVLDAFDQGVSATVARVFLSDRLEFTVPLRLLRDFLNVDDDEAIRLTARLDGVRAISVDDERRCTTDDKWHRLDTAVRATVRAYHAEHPLLPGMDVEALRAAVARDETPRLFRAVTDELAAAGVLVRDASLVRLPDYVVRLQDHEQQLSERVHASFAANPLAPPTVAELESTLGVTRQTLIAVLRVMERDGSIVRIAAELFFAAATIEGVKATLVEHFGNGETISPAAFRDRLGTSRKYVIPLLEYCDRVGFTIRRGDVRSVNRAKLVRNGLAPGATGLPHPG